MGSPKSKPKFRGRQIRKGLPTIALARSRASSSGRGASVGGELRNPLPLRFPGAQKAMRDERMNSDSQMEKSRREIRPGVRPSETLRNRLGLGGLCVLTAGLVLASIADQKLPLKAGAAELQGPSACEANGNSKMAFVKMDDESRLMITIRINNQFDEEFQIDTGADDVIIGHDSAMRMGLHLNEENYSETSETADDVVRIAPIVVDSLEIGSIRLTNVPSYVQQNNGVNLIGMSVLKDLKFSFQDGCFRIEK
jgi:clan AA aspartic protease (TIGR02281 family)